MALSIFYALHDNPSSGYKKHIESIAKIKILKAGEIIKLPGENKEAIYFVARGLLETYTIDSENRKRIIDFTWEKQACSSTISTYFSSPIEDFIQCVEDSVIIQFSVHSVMYIIANFNEGMLFYKKALKQYNKRNGTHLRLIQIHDIPLRVLHFQDAFKKIITRLSTEHQANYLFIGRSTFFDARKAILKKKLKL